MMKDGFHCQVCGIEIAGEVKFGTNVDGSVQPAYCSKCFIGGKLGDHTKMALKDFMAFAEKHMIEADHVPADVAKKNVEHIPTLIFWRYAETR